MVLFWTPWTLAWSALAVLTFVVLLFRVAPYGRHQTGSAGPTLPHRVGWIVMETVSPLLLLLVGGRALGWHWDLLTAPHLLLFGLWVAHYIYRAGIYPFLARWKNRRMPVLIMVSAIVFNLVNGSLNGFELALRPPPDAGSPAFLLGGGLFVLGLAINLQSDVILRRLRRPGDRGYAIPEGGLYRWISCPNYLGEYLEWVGFAIMAATPAALTFALWTAANLVPRALAHHRWYRQQFAMYPRQRKAVIPLIL
ncbi:MAG: DUF1295 domain-containing protein [Bacteroidetes bacterium]|nr:DUF1295 domain-containing protein [Bacteroidota bacterium]